MRRPQFASLRSRSLPARRSVCHQRPLSHVTATREGELSVHLSSSSYFGLHFQSVTLVDCTRAAIFLHLTTSHPSTTPLLDELEISL
jgi:hypothetical protein